MKDYISNKYNKRGLVSRFFFLSYQITKINNITENWAKDINRTSKKRKTAWTIKL